MTELIPSLIARRAAASPDAIAIEDHGRGRTYRELDRNAREIAAELQRLGAGRDCIVGVCMERSLELIEAIVGILYSGAAYFPIDPEAGEARCEQAIHDAEASIILTDARSRLYVAGHAAHVIEDIGSRTFLGRAMIEPRIEPNHLIYLIHTSGTTGTPKAAMNTHGGLANLIRWLEEHHPLNPSDRVLLQGPISFDASSRVIIWPLVAGATLVVAANELELAEVIRDQRITVVSGSPGLLEILLALPSEEWSSIRLATVGGEPLAPSLLRRIKSVSDLAVLNMYGPAETSIDATVWIAPDDFLDDCVPIGRPIANVRVYLLDPELRPVPLGEPGEIYLGGAAVGRGYWKRDDLTRARFLTDPQDGSRMYRTGDRGRWLEDGNLEYLGRIDDELKIKGRRADTSAIESILLEHPEVTSACVVRRESGVDDFLVAYVVASVPLDVEAMRAHLSTRLASYLIPARIVQLDALPLGPTGKVARRELAEREDGGMEQESARTRMTARLKYQKPAGALEDELATIWSEILGPKPLYRRDDFFALGGDSLALARIARRAADRLGKDVSLDQLSQARTLAAQARAIAAAPESSARASLERDPVIAPLTLGQQDALDHPEEGNEGFAVRVQGALDLALLEEAARAVVARHESLRARISPEGEQRIVEEPELTFEQRRADGLEALAIMRSHRARPFELARDPPLRMTVLELGADDYFLSFELPRVAFDPGSVRPFWRELYSAYRGREEAAPVQLRELAAAERREGLISIASSRRPGGPPSHARRPLSGRSIALVHRFCAEAGLTLSSVFIAAIAAELRAPSIATVRDGRDRTGGESVIGRLATPLILHLVPDREDRTACFAALRAIFEACAGRAAGEDLGRVAFHYRRELVPLIPILPERVSSEITFELVELGLGALELGAIYDSVVWSAEPVESLLSAIEARVVGWCG